MTTTLRALREGLKSKAYWLQTYGLNNAITITASVASASTIPSALINRSTSTQENTCINSWPGSAGYVTTACRPSFLADHDTWGRAATRRAGRCFTGVSLQSKRAGVVGLVGSWKASLTRFDRGGMCRQNIKLLILTLKATEKLPDFLCAQLTFLVENDMAVGVV